MVEQDLKYFESLTPEDMKTFWLRSFRINKNGDNRSSIRKGWLYVIARDKLDWPWEKVALIFNAKIPTMKSNVVDIRRRHSNRRDIDDLMIDLYNWKKKQV